MKKEGCAVKKISFKESALVVEGEKKKKNFMKRVYWTCGKSRYVKKKCPKGAVGSAGSSKSEVNNVVNNAAFLYGGNLHPHGMPLVAMKKDMSLLAGQQVYTRELVWH